jgi:ketosteroid isomerase-like protein
MKYTRIIIGTALAIACTGCAQAPATADTKQAETKSADTVAKDVADIKAMEDRFIKASASKDVNAIMSFYVPDASLFVFDVTPPRQYVGAAAYRKDWEDMLASLPGPIDMSISDLDVTAGGGDIAWGHSVQHMAGTMKDGKKMDLTVRITDGYKKINGQWLIAHEHVSVPVDVLTGKADLTSKP